MFIIFREWMDARGGKGRFPGSKDQGKAGRALADDQTERSYHVGVNLVMAWLLARRSIGGDRRRLCPAGIINVVTYSVT
jgi:hypothetical protein